MKETKEFLGAIAGTINSGFQAAADGKLGVEDIAYFFDDISRWQEGVKNLTFAQDAATATDAEVEDAFKAVNELMRDVPPSTRYNLVNGLKGLYCLYRLGAQQGQAQLLNAQKQ